MTASRFIRRDFLRPRAVAFAQFVNRFDDFGEIHFVDFHAPADFA
jgi:hypothetical protein